MEEAHNGDELKYVLSGSGKFLKKNGWQDKGIEHLMGLVEYL